ncbi:MAG: serine/threonine protein phosphatase [Verrucomicrobiae bacterium]|nr:serine/threonine protein phosphatase [Verrucomicrobiae bacterium]
MILALVLALVPLAWPSAAPAATPPPDYAAWRAACRELPTNRQLGQRLAPRHLLPLRSPAEFNRALDELLDLFRSGPLAQADAWLDGPPPPSFLDPNAAYYLQSDTPFVPFARRLRVPPGSRLLIQGDLHGDIHSLLACLDHFQAEGHLDGFRIVRPEVRMVFLGDYTDRGMHGVEVLYTLMRLQLANPEQVVLVRGNHEDLNLVARYGFLAELAAKFGRSVDPRRVVRLYDFLPAVLYLAGGPDVIQCNHGGLEPGYQPAPLLDAPDPVAFHWIRQLDQSRFLAEHPDWLARQPAATRRQFREHLKDFVPTSPTTPSVLGFLWNDFTVLPSEPQFAHDPARAFVYGNEAARLMFDRARGPAHRLRAVFRAHQHSAALSPVMRRLLASRGLYRHWQPADSPALLLAPPASLRTRLETSEERSLPDGSVWTFNVSPDSVYGTGCGFGFATVGELITGDSWPDWRLRVHTVQVVPDP